MPPMTDDVRSRQAHNAARQETYKEKSIKIRRIGNAWTVTEFGKEACAYMTLGTSIGVPQPGCDPLDVAEHIAKFFAEFTGTECEANNGDCTD